VADNFRAGTTLCQVIDRYKFNGGLPLLTMQAWIASGVAVRAVMTYEIAHDLGPFGYTDPANFIIGSARRSPEPSRILA
jgi:abortive infection bacteriophage resistance protein